ncbi:hypothetical protein HWV62_20784 [Athelia sp. TMB]|nr:hypothetical protein HWV62_20784 [Athelia sp. TMB]
MRPVANDQGYRVTLSWVSRLVGASAKKAYYTNANEPIEKDMKHCPFRIVDRGDEPADSTPEDISVTVLGGMEETAKAYLGETVTHAVATAPACELCNDAQRQATRDRYRQPEVEKAQRTLPIQQSTRPKIQSFEDGDDFFAILVPPKFEEISHTMKPVKQALKEANVRRTSKRLSSSLVGGSTRILEVQYLCGPGQNEDEGDE